MTGLDKFPKDYESFLKYEGRKEPYYFGLGFIKVRLSDQLSMNFYDPELGASLPPEEIHNHRYDFTSYVLAGEFTNVLYKFKSFDSAISDYVVYAAKCAEGEEPELMYGVSRPREIASFTMSAGSWYHMQHSQFHKVEAQKGAITCLMRGVFVTETAQVVRLKDSPSVCPYSVKHPQDELLARIKRLYEELPR